MRKKKENKLATVAKYSSTSVLPASALAILIGWLFPTIPDEVITLGMIPLFTFLFNYAVYVLEE